MIFSAVLPMPVISTSTEPCKVCRQRVGPKESMMSFDFRVVCSQVNPAVAVHLTAVLLYTSQLSCKLETASLEA